MTSHARRCSSLLALALAASCQGAGVEGQPPFQSAEAEHELPADVLALLAVATEAPVEPAGDRFVLRSANAGAHPRAAITTEVDPRSGDLLVRGLLDGVSLRATRLRALPPSDVEPTEGALHLRGAADELDALLFARPHGIEDLWRVREPGTELGYRLDLPPQLRLARASPQVIDVVDRAGSPRLRVIAARAWDATGAPVPVRLELSPPATIRVALDDATAQYPVYVDPEWRVGAAPAFEREGHTVSSTLDGRVALVGGAAGACDDELPIEVFDVRSMRFRVVGEALAARCEHSATVLRDGSLLLAGGQVDSDGQPLALDRVEVVDPATGAVQATATLATPRVGHTATRLDDGRVLIVGGDSLASEDDASPTEGTELWDPTTTSLVPGPPLHAPRAYHTASLLPDGRVLVAGGNGGPGSADPRASAELFDPQMGAWSLVADTMVAGRMAHSATLMHDGRVVLWGGRSATLWDLPAEVFDPGTQSFTSLPWHGQGDQPMSVPLPLGDLLAGRVDAEPFDPFEWPTSTSGTAARAVMLPFGRVFVTAFGGGTVLESREGASELRRVSYGGNFSEQAPRGEHAATLLAGGGVLLSGGHYRDFDTFQIPLPQLEVQELDLVTGAAVAVGPMARPRHLHSGTLLPDGRVLIAGGESPTGGDNRVAELYDPVSQSFTDSDRMDVDRAGHTATSLPNGDVLLVGGSEAALVERYFAATHSFQPAGELVQPRSQHTATRLLDGRVLVAGGGTGLLELYDPGSNSWATAGTLLAARTGHVAALLPDGSVLLAAGVVSGPPVEIWDPATETTREPLGALPESVPRGPGGQAVALASGDVLLCVPEAADDATIEGCALYRPTLDAFELAPAAGYGRPGGTMTRTLGGGVLRVGFFGTTYGWGMERSVDHWLPAPAVGVAPTLHSYPAPVPAGSDRALFGVDLVARTEATCGTTFASAADHPVAVWLPAGEGVASFGAVTEFEPGSATWQVPATRFPGPGSLLVSAAGQEGRAVPVSVLGASLGAGCEAGHECGSGWCADGVCCDRACGGCEACTAELKGAGADGTCGPLPPGTPPASDVCPAQPLSECGRTGVCDGDGACALVPEGTPCLDGAQCTAGVCEPLPSVCEGGHEILGGDATVVDCAPYRCTEEGPACLEACASGLDCVDGALCTARGQCERVDRAPEPSAGCSVGRPRGASSLGALLACVALACVVGLCRRRARRLAPLALTLAWLGCGSEPAPPPEGGGGALPTAGGGGAGSGELGGAAPTRCGDGVREGSEACDGDDLAGATCASLGLDGGTPHCRHDCTLDPTACVGCGNGYVDPGEACDGDSFTGTCLTLAAPAWILAVQEQLGGPQAHLDLVSGEPVCQASCTLDPSGCGYCMDGAISGTEECDAGPSGLSLGGATCASVSDEFESGQLLCDRCAFHTDLCQRATPPPCEAGANCSLVLGGTDLFVVLGGWNDDLSLQQQSLTIEGWFRHDDLDSAHRLGVARSDILPVAPQQGEWGLLQDAETPDALSLYARRPGTVSSSDPQAHWTIATAYDAISEDTWFHAAGVFDRDAGELRLYVDGALVAVSPFILGSDIQPDREVLLVSSQLATSDLGAGRADEIRISRGARYSGDFAPESRFQPDADTLALYHLDEGGGDVGAPLASGVLLDSSGNERHGELVNGVWSGEHP